VGHPLYFVNETGNESGLLVNESKQRITAKVVAPCLVRAGDPPAGRGTVPVNEKTITVALPNGELRPSAAVAIRSEFANAT
jgi:hypothetical protein